MNEDATFFREMAARCYELAKRCSPADRDVAEELLTLARVLSNRAMALGADADEIPEF